MSSKNPLPKPSYPNSSSGWVSGDAGEAPSVLPVSTWLLQTQRQLEGRFPRIWVEGELSNVTLAASGHAYFTLKDAYAQVRCVCFKSACRKLPFDLEQGKRVVLCAKATVYAARGDLQLQVTSGREAGEGALQQAFERLKKKLQQEGLFDEAHKKPLPVFPRCIGIVSSEQAAAWQDIIKVCRRRFPGMPLVLYPAPVQGKDAAQALAKALARANAHAHCDAIILARGGGSMEDLWAFNEEVLVRAVAASTLPVVTGVGHESDVTMVDFVSDVRAATPSAAAECVTPDASGWSEHIKLLLTRYARAMQRRLDDTAQRCDTLAKRLRHPGDQLRVHQDVVEKACLRFRRAMQRRLVQSEISLLQQRASFPKCMTLLLEGRALDLAKKAALLDALSPLRILARGYAVVQSSEGKALMSMRHLNEGDQVELCMKDGRASIKILDTALS